MIRQLKEGDIFGEESFFSGEVPLYTATCKNFANICRINRNKFITLIRENLEDYERFCYI